MPGQQADVIDHIGLGTNDKVVDAIRGTDADLLFAAVISERSNTEDDSVYGNQIHRRHNQNSVFD